MAFSIKIGKQSVFSISLAVYSILSLIPGFCIYTKFVPGWKWVTVILITLYVVSHFNYLRIKENINKIVAYFGLLVLFNLMTLLNHGELIYGSVDGYMHLYVLLLFYIIDRKESEAAFRFFLMAMTFLMFFALLEYILYLIGIKFLIGAGIERGEGTMATYCHGVFNLFQENVFFPRFQGLLREPGHLGTVAGIMLFGLGKIDKKLWTLWLIYGIVSLALGFYILLVLFLFYSFITNRNFKSFALILVLFLTFAGIYSFSPLLQDVANDSIFLRLQEAQEGSDLRTDATLDQYNATASLNQKLFGRGRTFFAEKDLAWGNTGMKADFCMYGFVGVSLLFLIAYSLVFRKGFKKYNITTFALLMICYYYSDMKLEPQFHIPAYALFFAEYLTLPVVYRKKSHA